jgi:hypothetical protein
MLLLLWYLLAQWCGKVGVQVTAYLGSPLALAQAPAGTTKLTAVQNFIESCGEIRHL